MIDANMCAQLQTMRGADGHLYLYDPHNLFPWATRVHIPQAGDGYASSRLSGPHTEERHLRRETARRVRHSDRMLRKTYGVYSPRSPFNPIYRLPEYQRGSIGLQGLGSVTPLEQGATMALNFIPGVGPILSGIASLAEGLLGGGDPTPEWKLEEEVLQLRDQIKQAHDELGIPDSFALAGPIGGGANLDVMRKAVTEALGHPGSGPTWRNDLYTAIHNLQGELQQISQQANNHEVVTQVLQALAQSPQLPTVPSNTPPDGTGSPPADHPQNQVAPAPGADFAQEAAQIGPWALGGVALVVVLLLVSGGSRGGSRS